MPVENLIQQRLGVKYTDAKKLLQEAQASLPDDATEAEIIEEACEIFEDLEPHEQSAMLKSQATEEPAWKKKAIAAAERREAEWKEQAEMEERGRLMAQQAEGDALVERTQALPTEQPGTTVTTTVTKTSRVTTSRAPLEVDGKVMCCTIL